MTDQDIISYSVLEIKENDDLLSKTLGVMNNIDTCETCGNGFNNCNGHMGYVTVPHGFFRPIYLTMALKILKHTCVNCLHHNIDVRATCAFCSKKFVTFEYEMVVDKVVLFIQCTKTQAYKIKEILYGAKLRQNLSLEVINLDLGIIRDIFHNFIINGDYESQRHVMDFDVKVLDCIISYVVPVSCAQLRVSQIDIGQVNIYNSIFQKIIRAKIYTASVEVTDSLFVEVATTQIHYWKTLLVSSHLLMSSDVNIDLQEEVGFEKFTQPPSLGVAAKGKDGFFRARISGVRLNKCCRCVITGDPHMGCNYVICPIDIAKEISENVRVNSENIDHLRRMIDNYPNYPCAIDYTIKINSVESKTVKINEKNKEWYVNSIQLGDLVGRQCISGDICLANRYPALREESCGCHIIIVEETKSIKFNLQVIKKYNADFDGDEMELFFLCSPDICTEVAMLSSMSEQLITYETGGTIIGADDGDPDSGFYWLQNFDKFETKFFGKTVTDSIDKEFATGYELVEIFLPPAMVEDEISYDDGKIIIEKGKLVKFGKTLCGLGSKFVCFLAFHYGKAFTIRFMDNVLQLAYKANEICGSSVYSNLFQMNEKNKLLLKEYTKEKLEICDKAIDKFYFGDFQVPVGLDRQEFFEEYLQALESENELAQLDILVQSIMVDKDKGRTIDPFNNVLAAKFQDELRQGCVELGEMLDEKFNRLMPMPGQHRGLSCYANFDYTSETEGYIKGNYLNGVTEVDMFLDCITGRWLAFKKGNGVKDDGYNARRLSKGADNVKAGLNGVLIGDEETIVSLQYGSSGYDPRLFERTPFEFHRMKEDEILKHIATLSPNGKADSHPLKDEMLQICKDLRDMEFAVREQDYKYEGFSTIVVPFIFKEKTVSMDELEKLWTCRLTQNMSSHLMESIQNQVMQFYIYALFYLKIDPKSKHDITSDYLKSLVSHGDPVGPKASMASTQPFTESTLKAIHKKVGGKIELVQLEFSTSAKRFMELTLGANGPIVFQTELLGDTKFDLKSNEEFVSMYETTDFAQLEPNLEVYYVQTVIELDIELSYKKLAYFNINLQQLIDQLYADFDVQKIRLNDLGETMMIECRFSNEREIDEIETIMVLLDTTYEFGSLYMYNVYVDEMGEGEDKYFVVRGNILPDKYNELLKIRGIDENKTYCSSERDYEDIYGIERCRSVIYNELVANMETDSLTQNLQLTHAKLMSDHLVQTGTYMPYTRQFYKKSRSRDFLQLVTYEEPDAFVEEEALRPKYEPMDTMLAAQTFGTRPYAGTGTFKIAVGGYLRNEKHAYE